MLFNSFEFIFGFLPITLALFYVAGRLGGARLALGWLTAASLVFYGWWNPGYLFLLAGSMGFNYIFGLLLSRPGSSRLLLATGIGANLAILGYFKYSGFLAESVGALIGDAPGFEGIVLPLAISFFTLQQIAFLVDVYRGHSRERDPFRYFLFVSFFPQLIAGPIVRHGEMVPQFMSDKVGTFMARNLAVGGTIFILGLGKKLILADSLAGFANPVFDAAASGYALTLLEAWGGALAYTFQIYFDFSGYSDMAIGLGAMLGLRLPVNFNSPYKAGSIIEFWRRWHITLSRFLLDYVYIPLGGNRKGRARLYTSLMIIMLLSGLWHGAGWTFVVWGGLHGIFLVTNQMWRGLRSRRGNTLTLSPFMAHALTFFVVVVAWVFFRADTLNAAFLVLAGMSGLNDVLLPSWLPSQLRVAGLNYGHLQFFALEYGALMIGIAAFVALALPNIQEIMRRFSPVIDEVPPYRGWLARAVSWQPNLRWSTATALIVTAALFIMFTRGEPHEFIYFQF